MIVALVTVPMVIHGLGKDRYGLLGIIWLVIGYFSLFDMGIGRALTKLVAENLGLGKREELPKIIWTAFWMILAMGVVGAVIGILASQPLIYHLLNVPPELRREGVISFIMASVSIPVVILSAAFIGVLEAHQKFSVITMVRIPLGVMTYLAPVISLLFTTNLVAAVGVLIFTRVIAMAIYFQCVMRVSQDLLRPVKWTRKYVMELFGFGGWITVSNTISPLMTYMDRLFIGGSLNLTAVTYYATPYAMLGNLQIIPQSIQGVLFPTLTTVAKSDPERLPLLYDRSTHIMFLLMLLPTSFSFLFAPELLQLWLGTEFRIAGTLPMQILSLGWTLSVIGNAPFTVLQSTGRPDLTAKIHLCTLPLYVLFLLVFTKHFGIVGTACTWALRHFFQTLVLNAFLKKIIPSLGKSAIRGILLCLGTVVYFAGLWLVNSLLLKGLLFAGLAFYELHYFFYRTNILRPSLGKAAEI